MAPLRIVCALGDAGRPADAIVIDHRNGAIYIRGRRRLFRSHHARITLSFRIMAALLCRVGRGPIANDELVEILWGDEPDGGPLTARTTIEHSIGRHLDLLEEAGIVMNNPKGGMGRYLEWATPEALAA